jgi:hypothetical protein
MAETIYINRDNKFSLTFKADDSAVDLSNSTKYEVLFLGNYYNSENFPNAFDLSDEATGTITFDLASIDSLEAGHDSNCEIIIYDDTNPEGIVWGTIDLTVKELEGEEVTE